METTNILNQTSAILLALILSIIFVTIGIYYSKKYKGLNNYLINVSNIADHTIFISDWLKKLFINSGFEDRKNSVIRNGANNEFFNFNKLTIST